ncbi:MAG: YafY family transcriptional regulator [Planctomycetia bacterium]|nr:YafY family transcriptional regulator [Planctomycetia bacterium]
MKVGKVVRLLELIGHLQAGRGSNAESLARELGVASRTIFRDLDTLKKAGVPLVYEESEQRYRIPTNYYLPPTNFTPQEALALLVLCYQLGDRSGLPFQTSARQAALKLESNLPSKLRAYVHDLAEAVRIRLPQSGRTEGHESTYLELLDAVGSHRAVRISYGSLSEQSEITTKLLPYQLLFSRRSWYVVGRSSLHREVRMFNLTRIKKLESLEDKFRVPARFNMERFLRNAWHLIPEPGPDRQVLIRFEPMVAHNVAEVLWHKTQTIEWRDDGRIDFRALVSGLHEIAWWVLGYGDQAEVIEPPELREIVRDRARKMCAKYDA